jgi:hypothetical protein
MVLNTDIVIDVAMALICFASQCYPALVGVETPKGEFQLQHYSTSLPNYGGDILMFSERGDGVYAIHRVLDLPNQQRLARLRSPYPRHRNMITSGCVNVDNEVYDKVVDCCSNSKVTIK